MDYSILLLVGILCVIGGIVWGKNQRDGWSILVIWFIFTPIITTVVLSSLYVILYGFSWWVLLLSIPLFIPIGIGIKQTVEDVQYKKVYDKYANEIENIVLNALPIKEDIVVSPVFKSISGSSDIVSSDPNKLFVDVRIRPQEDYVNDVLFSNQEVIRSEINNTLQNTFKKANVYIDFGYEYLEEKRKQSM